MRTVTTRKTAGLGAAHVNCTEASWIEESTEADDPSYRAHCAPLSLSDQGSGGGAVVSASGKAFDSTAVAPLPSTASLEYLTEIESAPATRSETKLSFAPTATRIRTELSFAPASSEWSVHAIATRGRTSPLDPRSSPLRELLLTAP